MSEPSYAGRQLTPEQEAYLRAQQAQQAAAEAQNVGTAAEQAAINAQMTQRGPLLPAEERIDDLMAQLRAQSEQLASMGTALASVQRQMEEAQAASGGPLVVRYAQGVADKIDALTAQWPNHPLGLKHFEPAATAAGDLIEAAKTLAKSGGNGGLLTDAAGRVQKFISRTHQRAGGHPIDWSAIIDDIDLAVEEGLKLAAVV